MDDRKQDQMMPCIICDIDGTLANNGHRQHYLEKTPKDWESFFLAAPKDPLYEKVREVLSCLVGGLCAPTFFCTGRMEKYRDPTSQWLKRHGILYHALLLRPDGDFRDDADIKLEMLNEIRTQGYEPYVVLDDRDQVVKMWRSQGILCLQVADGDF